jgi:hypothetical protein
MGNPMRRLQALKTGGPRLHSTETAHQSEEASHSISSGLSLSGLPPPPSSLTTEASSCVRDRRAIRSQAADFGAGRSAPLAGNFLEEEPWNSQSAFCYPREPSKNSEAVAKQVGRLGLRTPTHPDRLVAQATPSSEDTQNQRHENKSSAQRRGSGRANPGKAERPSYADITKGTRPKGVKYGQPAFRVGPSDDDFFACMCCKRKALCARMNNAEPYTIPLCPRVHDERSVRRGLAERHIRPDDDQGEKDAITDRVHKRLKGEAHRLAKSLARQFGLRGRKAEIFQYREGFAFLHPPYEPFKHLINPHGYDDPELNIAALRDAENGWPLPNASSVTNSSRVAAPPQSHHNYVAFPNQANTPMAGTQQAARPLIADRQNPQVKRARQHSPASPTLAQVARNAGGTPADSGQAVDPSAQRAARIPTPSNQDSAQPHHCSSVAHDSFGHGPSGIGYEQNSHWSQPCNQSQDERPPLPKSVYPPLPTSDLDLNQSEQEDCRPPQTASDDLFSDTDGFPPFAGGLIDYSVHHGLQLTDWATTRIPGHPSQVLSLPRTESTPLSSLPESTPGVTLGTGSSHTGHTSYYGPLTPGEPVTPTPQPRQDFLGLYIDPRLLEKQPLDILPKNMDTDALSEMEILPAIPKHGSRRSGGRKRQ